MGLEFQTVVYLACFITSTLCAWLLARGYQRSRSRLMFWTSLCFALLALNNLLVVADMIVFPSYSFVWWRQISSLAAVGVLLFGFVWESE